MSIREFVNELIIQSKRATPEQLAQLIDQASVAPFAEDLLEADEALWGSFWQGDVIAPGYRLPAVELALLRATRLDDTWPEGTNVPQFLADLHQAISDPQAGVWTLAVAGEPCVVFASVGLPSADEVARRGQRPAWGTGVSSQRSVASSQKSEGGGQRSAAYPEPAEWVSGRRSATVVWYCATTGRLHAGYRATIDTLNFSGAVEQRPLQAPGATRLELIKQPNWLEQVVEQAKAIGGHSLAARLDAQILHLRYQMRRNPG